MDRVVLLIDGNEQRRHLMAGMMSRAGVPIVEGADTFHAMAVLGRADFAAAIVAEERRHLAMRGFMMLARKRHPDIRLVVLMGQENAQAELQKAVGVPVQCIHPDAPFESVMSYIISSLDRPRTPFDIPSTTMVTQAVHDAVLNDRGEPTVPDRRAPPPPEPEPAQLDPTPVHTPLPPEPAPVATMEGVLDQESGSALMMGIYSQELTGRLVLDEGPAAGTLFFLRGEPVWAEDPRGDAGLFERLMAKGRIPPGVDRPEAPEGLMLSTMSQLGQLGGEVIHNAMRELVRDYVLSLCQVQRTAYRFFEDRAFLDVTPLLKVNAVGLMLEARRRSLLPEQLLAQSQEMANHHVVAAPGLATMAARLTPFTRGKDVTPLLEVGTTVEDFCRQSGLDAIMGTLVLLTLRDAKLVMLGSQNRSGLNSSVRLRAIQGPAPSTDPVVPEADIEMRARGTNTAARDAILSMYARLKPLNQPTAVLGLAPYASVTEIENAYRKRLGEVDAHLVPDGPEHALLAARLDELRVKLAAARQMLLVQSGEGGRDPSNPF